MKHSKMQDAIKNIQQYQKKNNLGGFKFGSGDWQLNVPVIRLALEGVAIFGVAFMCGKGIGVFYEVMVSSFFGS